MHFQITRRILSEPNDKSFHLPLAERDDHTATGLHRLIHPVYESPHERQANCNIGVHGGIRSSAGTVPRESVSCLPRLRASFREIATDKRAGMSHCRALRPY